MKVVVSIGGSVLVPEPGGDRVAEHAAVIEQLIAEGCRIGAVVGGGGVAREYISAARELGANEIELDQLGIDVTRLNARLLIAALSEESVTAPALDYEEASEALRRDDICIMGGVAPAQTTDAVGAALAEYIDADLIVYATGYGSMNGWAADLIGQEVADKVGKCWGLGSDTPKDPGPWVGEERNMWKPTRQEALWFHGGNLHQSRHYSQFLSLQLKARMEGIDTPVYGIPETHHLG